MSFFGTIKDKLGEYVDVRLKLYQVSLEEKAVELMSSVALLLALIGLAVLTIIFSLVFIAKLINHFVPYDFIGYGIIALICNFMFILFTRKHRREYFVDKIKVLIGENIKNRKDGGKDDGSL